MSRHRELHSHAKNLGNYDETNRSTPRDQKSAETSPQFGGAEDEPGLAGDPCSFHFTAAPTPKRRPRHVSPTKLAEELEDAGGAATSNCCLWPNALAAQRSFTVIGTLTLSHPAASGCRILASYFYALFRWHSHMC
jgi:hypothetical protein